MRRGGLQPAGGSLPAARKGVARPGLYGGCGHILHHSITRGERVRGGAIEWKIRRIEWDFRVSAVVPGNHSLPFPSWERTGTPFPSVFLYFCKPFISYGLKSIRL